MKQNHFKLFITALFAIAIMAGCTKKLFPTTDAKQRVETKIRSGNSVV